MDVIKTFSYPVVVGAIDMNKGIIFEYCNLNYICCSFNIHAQRHQERSQCKEI